MLCLHALPNLQVRQHLCTRPAPQPHKLGAQCSKGRPNIKLLQHSRTIRAVVVNAVRPSTHHAFWVVISVGLQQNQTKLVIWLFTVQASFEAFDLPGLTPVLFGWTFLSLCKILVRSIARGAMLCMRTFKVLEGCCMMQSRSMHFAMCATRRKHSAQQQVHHSRKSMHSCTQRQK